MRFSQFFEDDHGRLSMPRLAVFCTLPPAIWIMLNDYDKIDVVLAAYVLNYGIGKLGDAMRGNDVVGTSQSETTVVQSASTITDACDVESVGLESRRKTSKRKNRRAF